MKTSQSNLTIFPVLLVHFIGMLGYSLVMPFLVFLVQKFGGNEFIYGLMGAVYPAFQLIGAPMLGRWSDQIGRKRVLLISQAGTLLAWGLFMVALFLPQTEILGIDTEFTGAFILTVPLVMLFIARALDGLTGGNVSVANAFVSDISDDSNRKANFGKMAMAASLGFILGPALAGVLGATPLKEILPVFTAAGISLVALIVIQTLLPSTKSEKVEPFLKTFKLRKLFNIEQKSCYQLENCPDKTLKTVLKLPMIPSMFAIYFFTFLGFSFYYAGFPLYASTTLNWTSFDLGIYFTILSAAMVCVQGPMLSYLSKRVEDIHLVIVGSILLAGNFFLLTNGDIVLIYVALVFFALGNGLMWPSYLSMLSQTGDKNMQGLIQGYAESMGSFASIVGLIFGGLLFGLIGEQVFWVSGLLIMMVSLLAMLLWRNMRAVELDTSS